MDILVELMIKNLSKLVYKYDDSSLISGADLKYLVYDLRVLRAMLKDDSRKYKMNRFWEEWELRVRQTIYDMEDAIENWITETSADQSVRLDKANHVSLAELFRSLRKDEIRTLFQDYRSTYASNFILSDEPNTIAAETLKKRETQVVGMDDEATKLIGLLTEESNKLEVVSIIGMPGLGKTTIAWKVFRSPEIEYEFLFLIWVNISEDLNLRNVLFTILKRFTYQMPADATSTEDLGSIVKNHLRSGKFLIVMDDIRSPEAWEELKSFLPSNANGKVLITTREEKVACHVNVTKSTQDHNLRFLTNKESWELLQYEVCYKLDVVLEDLIELGKLISENCHGIPLSIVVIGRILKDTISNARGSVTLIKAEWEAASSMESILCVTLIKAEWEAASSMESILWLSYARLPYELRYCFLYLAVFPEDANISVTKLTLLWIAEAFIQAIEGKSLEDVAYDNLKDLINRNLLMVEKANLSGEPKVCRVHDTIRHFCRTKAYKLNLFKEVRFTNGAFEPSQENLGNCRRLCVHSNAHNFFKGKPKVYKARSFLCFSKSPIILDTIDIAPVTEAFHLLRVLDAENMKFPKFPQKLVQLIHLKYLTLTLADNQMKFLPSIISNLVNLQTLLVDIPSHTLVIRANIWIMVHLRHLKTKASIVLNDGRDEGKGGENLQTLERLSPESCTEEVFNKARNLNKLGIQGDLNSTLNFNFLEDLYHLKTLKLVHVVHNEEAAKNPMHRLPESFPPYLKILVLTSTYLKWEQMSALGSLDFLKSLKLKENAFTGSSWEVCNGDFWNLELLDIGRADVVLWEAPEGSFRKLRFLSLKSCEGLEEVPVVLGKKLEVLSLESVTKTCVSSARRFKEAREDLVLKIASQDDTT